MTLDGIDMRKLSKLRALLLLFSCSTLLTCYLTVASGELSPCPNGRFSVFSDNPFCRAPSIFAVLFYTSLGISLLVLVRFLRERRRAAV